MLTGLQVFINSGFKEIKDAKIALIVNHTSVDEQLQPLWKIMNLNRKLHLKRIFSPEHGLWGVAQDQELVENDEKKVGGIDVVSLYHNNLAPTEEMLSDLDVLIFDIQDIGVRYYTFIYTMLLSMKKCEEAKIKFIVLDRPNPLGGIHREGNILEKEFASFVGMFEIPVVHGLTAGEIAVFINKKYQINCDLTVIPCQGWNRKDYFDDTNQIWVAPSPNMPNIQTAIVYAGGCLFEATNISEGRGTTMPFLQFGAPWIKPWKWYKAMVEYDIPGIVFRPHFFKPLTNKYANEICGGLSLHVTNKELFPSYFCGIAMIKTAYELYPNQFEWKMPPYEFEKDKMPIDILTGTDKIRKAVENHENIFTFKKIWDEEIALFNSQVLSYLLYN